MYAWHYTIGECMKGIRATGYIRLATAVVPKRERAAVWLSAHPKWEPTANKMLLGPGGTARSLSFAETIEHGGGGFRIGYPAAELLPWPALIKAARIHPRMVEALKRAGREQGADPYQWYGSLEPLPLAAGIVERWGGGAWVSE